MQRDVQPERLDSLPADDRRAMHSRVDLRRINGWMGNAGALSRLLSRAWTEQSPASVVELGAGDGSLLLKVARRLAPRWTPSHVMLVDQQALVSPQIRAAFAALSWPVEIAKMDVFEWLERRPAAQSDVTLANLFLHHFTERRLRRLLTLVSEQTQCFAACEPRRTGVAFAATRLLPLIGCNDVTRHDARASVQAGFANRELSALWPSRGWTVAEQPAGPFTHCFSAVRTTA